MQSQLIKRLAGKVVTWSFIIGPIAYLNLMVGLAAMVWLSIGEKVIETRNVKHQRDIKGFSIKEWFGFYFMAACWPRHIGQSHYKAAEKNKPTTGFHAGKVFGRLCFVWAYAVLLLLIHPLAMIAGLIYLLWGERSQLTREKLVGQTNETFISGASASIVFMSKAIIWPLQH